MGAWALRRRKASALFWLLVGGSASIYLGLMDVLFDLENGVYAAPKGDVGAVVTEVAINLLSLGIGGWALFSAGVTVTISSLAAPELGDKTVHALDEIRRSFVSVGGRVRSTRCGLAASV